MAVNSTPLVAPELRLGGIEVHREDVSAASAVAERDRRVVEPRAERGVSLHVLRHDCAVHKYRCVAEHAVKREPREAVAKL